METSVLYKTFNLTMIETERLSIRLFEAEDLNTAYRLFNDSQVQKFLSAKNRRTREQLEVLIKNSVNYWKLRGFGMLCVADKSNGEMIGYCGFQNFDGTSDIEIAFAFLKEHWGKGIATEAAKGCLKFGFEKLGCERIFAVTVPGNAASLRVLEKSGMSFLKKEIHYEMETVTYCIAKN